MMCVRMYVRTYVYVCMYVRVRHALECRGDITQECSEHAADTYS